MIITVPYIFYPIFDCGLYCRAAYNAEQLIFHDSFLSNPYTKDAIEDGTTNRKDYFFVVHMYYIIAANAVYTAERFVLQETFLSLKIPGL